MTVAVSIEAGPKKVFASAVDWPGWCRAGKTEELALEALAIYAERYAIVAREAGVAFAHSALSDLDVVERVEGAGGTAFGVPSVITELERREVTTVDAERLAGLVEAAWAVFDRVVAAAPADLRKGPRGGGRDRDKMVAHVVESDVYYARLLGLPIPYADPMDPVAAHAQRAATLETLRRPSDGTPLAGRTWTLRYACRRIAWHALDHAWEMEDRSTSVR